MKIFKNSLGEMSYLAVGNPKNDVIILLHGNSCNAEMFQPQFKDLSHKYFVIAPNLPGHGESSKPINESVYSLQGLAKTIKDLIEHLALKNVILYGASLGGHVVIELISMLKQELNGIMISGAPPFKLPLNLEECFNESAAMGYIFKPNLNEDELEELVDAWIFDNESVKKDLKIWVSEADPQFRSQLGNTIAHAEGMGNEWKIIEEANVPVAILSGEHENLLNHHYITQIKPRDLFNDSVQIVPNSLHFPNLENPSVFNKLLEEFASYCDQHLKK